MAVIDKVRKNMIEVKREQKGKLRRKKKKVVIKE